VLLPLAGEQLFLRGEHVAPMDAGQWALGARWVCMAWTGRWRGRVGLVVLYFAAEAGGVGLGASGVEFDQWVALFDALPPL